jgi:hypothetical protein
MNQREQKLVRYLRRTDPGWNSVDLDQLTQLLTSTLGEAIGLTIEPLSYDGIDNPRDNRTADFLWLRFRSQPFTPASEAVLVGGVVFASRDKQEVSGFLQFFINSVPVRPIGSGQMLVIDYVYPTTRESAWRVKWETHDFVEEYDQYTLSYFRDLDPLHFAE